MSLRVHFHKFYSTEGPDLLRRYVNGDLTITVGEEPPADADYQILVTGFPDRAHLTASPHLQAVIVPFAGVPAPTRALLAEFPDITLHNIHYNVAPTGEMALALMLAAVKFIVPIDRQLRNNDWTSRYNQTPVTILQGKTAMILGYGQIGQYIAPVCQALGMTVIGVRRDPPAPGDQQGVEVYPPRALHTLLPRTDVLLNILPHTPETHGLIGAAELALLPEHAVLVNVGRGATVDEEALYHALRSGKLLAAGLDVWWSYPESDRDRTSTPPSRFPFHELDNVVMSPHRAGYLSAAEEERMQHLAVLFNACLAGEPMPNQVNKELGY